MYRALYQVETETLHPQDKKIVTKRFNILNEKLDVVIIHTIPVVVHVCGQEGFPALQYYGESEAASG